MKLDILAFGAHPDDVELGCGATLAKLINQGKKAGIIDLTQGEMGTRGTSEERLKEANTAAKILGISKRDNLKMKDGFFENDQIHQLQIIKSIRKYRPEMVFANAPSDRHPDHGKGAELVAKAAFLSGLRKIDTGQEAWRPKHIFHYIQWYELKSNFIIDVSGFLDSKIKACMAYRSQFYDPKSGEPETPISSQNFLNSIRYRAENLGRLIGTSAGEEFISTAPIGMKDFESFIS